MPQVTIENFAESFGTRVDDFSNECIEAITSKDFSYRELRKEERDDVILDVLRKIEADRQVIAAPERKEIWERGWAENLEAFKRSRCDRQSLVPKFIRQNQPIRFRGDFIMPSNPCFEYDYMTVFRIWLFQKFFRDLSAVYEFGCGTGLNLVLLADLFPGLALHGLDFVPSAVELVNEIGLNSPENIQGHLFNMIHPDEKFDLEANSGVFTFGAIEQLAGKFEHFLEFLLKRRPKLVINMEPTVEFYDENLLFDYIAKKFHQKRGYTENLWPRLLEMEQQGKIKIHQSKRLYFGSLLMEGYSYYVWQPC